VRLSYRLKFLPFFLILCGCATKSTQNDSDVLTSIQIIDRNGFSETISVKSRLANYENVNFLEPQPYKKVMQVFGKMKGNQAGAKITSYHPNGQPWQYLEVESGRAHGNYHEWHPNGKLRLTSYIIEGLPDIGERAQLSWIFNGKSTAYDEDGHLIAEIFYEKGSLETTSLYYHANGQIAKSVPYRNNKVQNEVCSYNEAGELIEQISYKDDLKDGKAKGLWSQEMLKYQEEYHQGLLKTAAYYTKEGALIAEIKEGRGTQASFIDDKLHSLSEFQEGVACGKVEIFDSEGFITNVYHIQNEKKQGEEWEYFSKTQQPKLYLNWNDDTIQGMTKTWYSNGVLQSEREIHGNKKHGLAFAWYEEGQLMLMEEYDNDILIKGSYYKKGDKLAVSKVDEGNGVATLYDSKGHFLKKITYERGTPLL
jgi:antitoxin component YwqK of YwqJK toxin-antitoxin module